MDKARILFVYPPPCDIAGEVIDLCEGDLTLHSLPCHVAVYSNGGLWEALTSGVTISTDVNKYPITKIVEVNVPDLATAEAWALKQVGRPYSLLSCGESEIYATTGEEVDLPQKGTDCSQLACDYIRSAGRKIFDDEPAAWIRPSDLLDKLQ
jgi:uncharacterized protein YycO